MSVPDYPPGATPASAKRPAKGTTRLAVTHRPESHPLVYESDLSNPSGKRKSRPRVYRPKGRINHAELRLRASKGQLFAEKEDRPPFVTSWHIPDGQAARAASAKALAHGRAFPSCEVHQTLTSQEKDQGLEARLGIPNRAQKVLAQVEAEANAALAFYRVNPHNSDGRTQLDPSLVEWLENSSCMDESVREDDEFEQRIQNLESMAFQFSTPAPAGASWATSPLQRSREKAAIENSMSASQLSVNDDDDGEVGTAQSGGGDVGGVPAITTSINNTNNNDNGEGDLSADILTTDKSNNASRQGVAAGGGGGFRAYAAANNNNNNNNNVSAASAATTTRGYGGDSKHVSFAAESAGEGKESFTIAPLAASTPLTRKKVYGKQSGRPAWLGGRRGHEAAPTSSASTNNNNKNNNNNNMSSSSKNNTSTSRFGGKQQAQANDGWPTPPHRGSVVGLRQWQQSVSAAEQDLQPPLWEGHTPRKAVVSLSPSPVDASTTINPDDVPPTSLAHPEQRPSSLYMRGSFQPGARIDSLEWAQSLRGGPPTTPNSRI